MNDKIFIRLATAALKTDIVQEYRFHPTRKWRFDFAIPTHKIALEVEGGVWTGGRHISPKGFLGDMEKYNTATIMGWRVVRTTPQELCSARTIKMLETLLYNPFNIV